MDEEGQVFILHLAIGKQKGAGGMRSGERREFGIGGWGLGNCGVRNMGSEVRIQESEYRIKDRDWGLGVMG